MQYLNKHNQAIGEQIEKEWDMRVSSCIRCVKEFLYIHKGYKPLKCGECRHKKY